MKNEIKLDRLKSSNLRYDDRNVTKYYKSGYYKMRKNCFKNQWITCFFYFVYFVVVVFVNSVAKIFELSL